MSMTDSYVVEFIFVWFGLFYLFTFSNLDVYFIRKTRVRSDDNFRNNFVVKY